MKRTILAVVALAILLMAGPSLAVDLIADGGDPLSKEDIGWVGVWNDDTNLYVEYGTLDGWKLVATHLHVATVLDGIPQTGSGNPKVGHFAYQTEHDPTVTNYMYTVPLSAISDGAELGDTVYIAAHADVKLWLDDNGTPCDPTDDNYRCETAWGGCWNDCKGELDYQFPGKNWAAYFTYRIPDPDLIVSQIILDDDEIYSGDILVYTYTVENIEGEGPDWDPTFDVATYLSTDAVFDGSDTELGWGYSAWTYHLDVGWSQSQKEDDVAITATPGPYYLIVVADAKPGQPPNYYPGVVETNEDNNWLAIQFTVVSP